MQLPSEHCITPKSKATTAFNYICFGFGSEHIRFWVSHSHSLDTIAFAFAVLFVDLHLTKSCSASPSLIFPENVPLQTCSAKVSFGRIRLSMYIRSPFPPSKPLASKPCCCFGIGFASACFLPGGTRKVSPCSAIRPAWPSRKTSHLPARTMKSSKATGCTCSRITPPGSRISTEHVNGVQSRKGSKTGAIRFNCWSGRWKVSRSEVCRSRELTKQLGGEDSPGRLGQRVSGRGRGSRLWDLSGLEETAAGDGAVDDDACLSALAWASAMSFACSRLMSFSSTPVIGTMMVSSTRGLSPGSAE
mmetsp:Transcript_1604/g.3541  ORF Transcript_1604/g.3541 Transcript_1604/m.3541 type:complete len:303 (-) Transcript_1604:590-1498(-)